MPKSEFLPSVLFRIGPVEVTSTVMESLFVSAILIVFALLVRVGIAKRGSAWQTSAEFVLEHFEGIMREMFHRDPRSFTPLIVTLALFIGVANLLGVLPLAGAPTADFSTTAALAVIVFFAVPFYGIRERGVLGYFKHYLEPSPFLAPLEVITEFSRTLALAVRLFGNVVSDELVIAVLVSLAGFLIPVPLMTLAVLTGVVQAYIFAVLTIVYLSAAVRRQESGVN